MDKLFVLVIVLIFAFCVYWYQTNYISVLNSNNKHNKMRHKKKKHKHEKHKYSRKKIHNSKQDDNISIDSIDSIDSADAANNTNINVKTNKKTTKQLNNDTDSTFLD